MHVRLLNKLIWNVRVALCVCRVYLLAVMCVAAVRGACCSEGEVRCLVSGLCLVVVSWMNSFFSKT